MVQENFSATAPARFFDKSDATTPNADKSQAHKVKKDVLNRWGADAHAAPPYTTNTNGNDWKIRSTYPAEVDEEYLAEKIESASTYINTFPYFDDEDIYLTIDELERLEEKEQADIISSRKNKYLRDMEKGEAPTSMLAAYRPEPNRLVDFALSEDQLHNACKELYNSRQTFVGSIEAALIAMDLTSEMNGVWRIPITLVTKRRWDRNVFSYVCVLIVFGNSLALLGRSRLPPLSYVRLRKARTSELIDDMRNTLEDHDHELQTIYMGLPVQCPVSRGAPHPVIWRYLKISCKKQAWPSVLAACDLYVSQRKVFWSSSHFAGRLTPKPPPGFEWLTKQKGHKMRLKTTAPLLTRAKRPKQRKPLKIPDPLDMISASGTWQIASEESFLRDVYGTQFDGLESDCSSVSTGSRPEFAEDQTLGLLPKRLEGNLHYHHVATVATVALRKSATVASGDAHTTSADQADTQEGADNTKTNPRLSGWDRLHKVLTMPA